MLPEQRTLTISRAAAKLGCSASWLRLAERLGVIPPARRTAGGHRYYTPADLDRLRGLGVGSRPRRLKQIEEMPGVRS
jgi:DNA-binding transcriptional MerR regulator